MTEKPYDWEEYASRAWVDEDKTCEYGYPETCGKKAVFLIPGGKPLPGAMFACREHVLEMAVTGYKPKVIVRGEKPKNEPERACQEDPEKQ